MTKHFTLDRLNFHHPGGLEWTIYAGFWTLAGILLSCSNYLTQLYYRLDVQFPEALVWGLATCYAFGVLAPFVVVTTKEYYFSRESWPLSLSVHFLVSSIFIILHSLLLTGSARIFISMNMLSAARFDNINLSSLILKNIHFDLLMYTLIVVAAYIMDYHNQNRQREERTAELEAELQRVQLQVLKTQIHPHFLFNTLHTISTLVYKDAQVADKAITRLSELLRTALRNSTLQMAPLRQELEFLKMYLDIIQTRFQNKLTVEMDIDDNTLGAQVPYLILQPLVENAIRHGIATRNAVSKIKVTAFLEGANLMLEVADNGPGFQVKEGSVFEKGFGLSITSKRLIQLYGSEHRLILSHKDGGGLTVTLEIPFRMKEDLVS